MKKILKKGMIVTSLAICIMAISPATSLKASYPSDARKYDMKKGYWMTSGAWSQGNNTSAKATIYNDDGNDTEADSKVCLMHQVTGPDQEYSCRTEHLDNHGDENSTSKSSSSLKGDQLYAGAKLTKIWDVNYMVGTIA